MYRIGGGPVVVVGKDSRGRNKRAPVVAVDRPRIGFVKGPDGKIVSERKAQTLAASRPVNRPFGKPVEVQPTVRGASGRMASNPKYATWKNSALGYNASLSRQQVLQPKNTVLGGIKPVETNPTARFPAPISVRYRSGREQTKMKPKPDASPFRQTL
jgi:hypothetical protein